ncbi:hypothetical protein EDC96DRAFT_549264 [Choanephora cucurbitarum]|nr:hypothetical protein EDC96DRAFT_549264 [Choanephora cucurbitarum]
MKKTSSRDEFQTERCKPVSPAKYIIIKILMCFYEVKRHEYEKKFRSCTKWTLKSCRVVEEVIFEKAKDFKFEHPAQQLIMDVDDDIWVDAFTKEELDEIKSACNCQLFDELPSDVYDLTSKVVEKNNYDDIVQRINSMSNNVRKAPVESWLKGSFQNAVDLFFNQDTIKNDFRSENHLLYTIWYLLTSLNKTTQIETDGNASSMSSRNEANRKRSLSSYDATNTTSNSRMADFYYKYLDYEMGCIEIGLKDKGQWATKEFNELNFKCPLMLASMLHELSSAYSLVDKMKLCTVGFVISGFTCTALSVNFSPGSTLVVVKSDRFLFCENITEFKKIVPLLHLAYHAKCIFEKNVNEIVQSFQRPMEYVLRSKRLRE